MMPITSPSASTTGSHFTPSAVCFADSIALTRVSSNIPLLIFATVWRLIVGSMSFGLPEGEDEG